MATYAQTMKDIKLKTAQMQGTTADTAAEDKEIENAQVRNALRVSVRPSTEKEVQEAYTSVIKPSNVGAYVKEGQSRVTRQLQRNSEARTYLSGKGLGTDYVDSSDAKLKQIYSRYGSLTDYMSQFKSDEEYDNYQKKTAFDERAGGIKTYSDWKRVYDAAKESGDSYTQKLALQWGMSRYDAGTAARAEQLTRESDDAELEKLYKAEQAPGRKGVFKAEMDRRESEKKQAADEKNDRVMTLREELESGYTEDADGSRVRLTDAQRAEKEQELKQLQADEDVREAAGPPSPAQTQQDEMVNAYLEDAKNGNLDSFYSRYMADSGDTQAYKQAGEGSYSGENADAQGISDELSGIWARFDELDAEQDALYEQTGTDNDARIREIQAEKKELAQRAELLQAEAAGKAKEAAAAAQDDQREARELLYGEGSWLKLGAKSAFQGLSQWSNSLYSTLDKVLGQPVTKLGQLIDEDYKSLLTRAHELSDRSLSQQGEAVEREIQALGGGTAVRTTSEIVNNLAQNAMNAVMGLMSGGTAAAGGIATTQGAAVKQMATAGGSTLTDIAGGMLSSPTFWNSAAQEIGPDIEEAKEQGASDLAAAFYGVVAGMINGGIEVGGGIETMGMDDGDASLISRAIQAAADKDLPLLTQLIDTATDEGKEEVYQYSVAMLARKAFYDHELPYYSTREDAVINPVQQGQNAAMGAAVGGLMGGGHAAINAGVAAATKTGMQDKAAGAQIVSNDWQQTLANVAQGEGGITDATVKKLLAGGKVSLKKVGRLYRETMEKVSSATREWFESSLSGRIEEALKEGGYKGNTKLAATTIAKAYGLEDYETLTDKESSILAEPEVQQVLSVLEGETDADAQGANKQARPGIQTPLTVREDAETQEDTQGEKTAQGANKQARPGIQTPLTVTEDTEAQEDAQNEKTAQTANKQARPGIQTPLTVTEDTETQKDAQSEKTAQTANKQARPGIQTAITVEDKAETQEEETPAQKKRQQAAEYRMAAERARENAQKLRERIEQGERDVETLGKYHREVDRQSEANTKAEAAEKEAESLERKAARPGIQTPLTVTEDTETQEDTQSEKTAQTANKQARPGIQTAITIEDEAEAQETGETKKSLREYVSEIKRADTLRGVMQTLRAMPRIERGAMTATEAVEGMSMAAAAAEKAKISTDGETHAEIDGRDYTVETIGIAWSEEGMPLIRVRTNGETREVAPDKVTFADRDAAVRAMAASVIGGTEAANTLYNAKVQEGTRYLDYARDFMSAYNAAGLGITKGMLRYAGTLTALSDVELDAAYEMGKRNAQESKRRIGLVRSEAVAYFKGVLEAAGEENAAQVASALADAMLTGTVSSAQNVTLQSSPAAMAILQGKTVRTDMDGTITAAAYGASGRSYAELLDTLRGMGMTQEEADSNAVREAYNHAKAQDAEKAQKKTAKPKKAGGVRDITAKEAEEHHVRVISREGLNSRQKAYIEALDTLGKAVGAEIVLYESRVENGAHVGQDGWYDRGTGTIYIDVEAGYNGEQAMMRVAAHEMTHFIEQWNAKAYKNLRDLLLDYYYGKDYDTVRGLVQEQMDLAEANGQHLTEEEAMDEVIASACEMMLSDGAAIRAVAEGNRTLGAKIKGWIEEVIAKIENALKELAPHSRAAKLLAGSRETLERAREMWIGALDEVSQSEEGAEDTAEAGTQNSNRGQYDYSRTWEEQIADLRSGKLPERDTLLLGRTPLLYRQMGLSDLPMVMTREHVQYMFDGKLNNTTDDHLFSDETIKSLPELIADPVAVIASEKAEYAENAISVIIEAESRNGKQGYAAITLNSLGKINGESIDANRVSTVYGRKAALDELQRAVDREIAYRNGESDAPAVYYLNKEKADTALQDRQTKSGKQIRADLSASSTLQGANLSESALGKTGLMHSILDAGSPVNKKFLQQTDARQFKHWFGKSVIKNADGSPKVMYRGDNNEIHVFDRKRSKPSNLYGRGFYFTQDAGAAGVYGNVNAYYLRVETPLDASSGAHAITQKQLRAFLQEVADNEDYGLDNYGYGATVESVLRNLHGKADFDALQDINATAVGDLVAAVELFNEVNGTHYDGIITPTETVVFDSAQIKSATENAGTFDRGNPDIRYSNRDVATNGIRMGQSDAERYQWLRDTEIEAASVSAEQITPQQIALVNGLGYTKAMTLLEKAAKSYGLIADGKKTAAALQNRYLSIAAEFSNRSLRESIHKQSDAAEKWEANGNGYLAALLPVFKETYENAVPVLVQGDRYLRTVTDQSKVQTFVYLLGAFQYGNQTIPVQFELKQLKGDGNRIYVVATIKEAAIKAASFQGAEAPRRATTQSPTISIEDVIANVNPEDTRILANLPSYMLSEEQQEGKRKGLREKGEYTYNKARAAGQDVNAPVKLTQERIDSTIKYYGGSGDYSKAYMAMMRPTDFLSLTSTNADRIRTDSRAMVAEEMRETDTPFLQYDPETNEITGHEGRHRMAAMENSRVRETPVLLIPDGSEGRYNRQVLDSLTVTGQTFGTGTAQGKVTVRGLIPVNEKHRAELETAFGGGESWFRYSNRDGTQSNRQLLAQAFESVARNDADRRRLREYQGRIAELDTKTAELKALEADLSDLSQVEWTEEETKENQKRARELRREIVDADAVLLRMEGTEDLQRVAGDIRRTREKEIERDVRAQARESMRRYREGVERRELAGTIKRRSERLAKWITEPSSKGSVPKALQSSIASFLLGIEQSQNAEFTGKEGRKREQRFRESMGQLVRVVSELQEYQQADAAERVAEDFGGYLDLPRDFTVQMAQVVSRMEQALEGHSGGVVDNMDIESLRRLNEMLLTISNSVRQANELLTVKGFEHVGDAAKATMHDIRRQGKVRDVPRVMGIDVQGFLQWENTQPIRAFERFGKGGRAIFDALRDGQGQLAFDAQQIISLSEAAYTGKEAREWEKEIRTFDLSDGRQLRMPVTHLMSLYCLIKREQAVGHILGEGIRVADFKEGSRTVRGEGTVMDMETAERMTATLTARQRQVADRLQNIMSTVGSEWGNYVSVRRFGYEMFTESAYFPIEVDSDRLNARTSNQKGNDLYRLLNISAAKTLTRGASNRIMLNDIFDVYANHMSDMAQYHAMALPVLDAIKWLNYSEVIEDGDGTSHRGDGVRDAMRDVFGSGAGRYVSQLISDVSGRQFSGDWGEQASKALLGRANRQAVAANLRVALLQPTSIVRAGMELGGTEIMLGAIKNLPKMRENIEEMQRYSGIAAWKALGFFDMNISKSINGMIKHTDTVTDRIMEAAGQGAEWGDKITWAAMWEACKENVRRSGRSFDTQDAYLRAVSEKFDDVIYKTQVVDSILTRSQLMRSTNFAAKMLTSFMSEPTTTYNMLLATYEAFARELRGKTGTELRAAFGQAWQKHGKLLGRTFAVYGLSAVISALVETLMDAARDNDDYETYMEKWVQAFWGNLGDNLNPMNLVPMISDLMEIAQGYEPDNPLWSGVYSLADSVKRLIKYADGESTAEWYGVAYPLLQGASQVTGLPLATAMRDAVMMWNNTAAYINPRLRIEKYQSGTSKGTAALYEAIISGDSAREALVRRQLAANDADESKIASGLERQIKQGLSEGSITSEEAQELLQKYCTKKEDGKTVPLTEDDAYYKVQKWGYDAQKTAEDADYSPYMALEEAIRTGSGIDAAVKELTSHGYTEKAVNSKMKELIRDAYLDGDISESRAGEMLTTYVTKTEDGESVKLDSNDAYWLQKEWQYEDGSEEDFSRFDTLTAALQSGSGVQAAITELTSHGYTKKEAASKVKSITGDLYVKGKITKTQAQNLLSKYATKTVGGTQTALDTEDIWGEMNRMEYRRLTGETSSSDYAMVYWAIGNRQSPKQYIDDALQHGKTKSAIASGITTRYKEEYLQLRKTDVNAASILKGRLCSAFDYLGYDGLKKVSNWEE